MGWLIVLAGTLLFLTADSARKLAAFRTVTALGEKGRPAPAPNGDSPTGRETGRRNQILQSTDGYHWVMQTQQMIATGEWRLRRVNHDNAPDGREVHWGSPLRWWLALVAWADHAVVGRPWLVSVEHAALYAGPVLLGLFLLAVVPWTARRFGAWPASLLAAGMVTVAPFSGEFGTGSFDHHGVAAGCALLTGLLLLGGWTSPPEQARRLFIASGIAGAAGLWINAATQIPVLAGIGAGALLAQHLTRHAPIIDPRLWRAWGLAGGAAALAFYLLEYFPAHLGWRLEVNHPLHALAWAGAGDLLARFGERRKSPLIALSALAVAAPVVVVLLAPARTFVVADKFLWTLHVDYITEFAPLAARLNNWEAILVTVNVLPLLGLLVLWFWRGGLAAGHRGLLALGLAPAVLITFLSLFQQRWLHVSSALWLGVLVSAAFITASGGFVLTGPRRAIAGLFLALVLLPYPLQASREALRGPAALSRENIRQFAVRDLAFWLRRHTGDDPVTVLSGPTVTTELIYHGGFRGIGTLYWENLAGLRTLVDIQGAADANRARELIQQHGITHLILLPWGSFAEESARLAAGLRTGDRVTGATFAQDLLSPGSSLPDWVRPLPYRLPDAEQFKGQVPLVLEVVPAQSPADAAVGRAQYLAAMGSAPAARELLRQVLAIQPDHLMALVTLAQLQRAERDRAGHGMTLWRVQPLLTAARSLEPRHRVALAVELAAGGMAAAARSEVVLCWESLDVPGVRRMPPELLPLLLRATRDFKVSPPPELLALAEKLRAADRQR
jgi:hypothetical protein